MNKNKAQQSKLQLIFYVLLFVLTSCSGNSKIQIVELSKDPKNLVLNVLANDKIIQKIVYQYPLESQNAVFVEKKFEIIDVNFDGFKDILIYLGSYGNQGVVYKDCFLWNDKKYLFENYSPFKSIPNPQIDENERRIYGNLRNSFSHYIYKLYSWDKNKLNRNYEIHKIHSAVQLAEIYEIAIPKDKDAGEYMLEYFGLDKKLYESIFYVKKSFDMGKVSRSKPTTKIFDEIPQKLKDLLK
ncbi:MAG: XAC2610-related protein [Helicobacteraceae bacterium]